MSEMKKLKCLSVIEKNELNQIFKDYVQFKWLYYSTNALIISVLAILGAYEIYITESDNSLPDYNSTKTLMVAILGCSAFGILILYVFSNMKRKTIKNNLRDLTTKHDFEYNTLLNEFNSSAKSSLGGPGI